MDTMELYEEKEIKQLKEKLNSLKWYLIIFVIVFLLVFIIVFLIFFSKLNNYSQITKSLNQTISFYENILNKKFSDSPISNNDENNFILNNTWNFQNGNVLRIYNNNTHIILLWKNKINHYFKKTIFQLDFELNYKYFEGMYNIQNIIKRLVYLFNTEKYNIKENDDKLIIDFEKVKCIDDDYEKIVFELKKMKREELPYFFYLNDGLNFLSESYIINEEKVNKILEQLTDTKTKVNNITNSIKPVYGYFHKENKDHVYLIEGKEKTIVDNMTKWENEGIQFYVLG